MPIDPSGNIYLDNSMQGITLPAELLNVPSNMAALVPLTYWQTGAPTCPEAAADRLSHLATLAKLSRGSLEDLGLIQPVQANYWGRAASFLASLFASFPPTISGIDPTISEPLTRSLRTALTGTMYDVVRFGTGLLRLRTNMRGEPKIEHLDPRCWFPAASMEALADEAWADAIVVADPGSNIVRVLTLVPFQYSLSEYICADNDLLGTRLSQVTGPSSMTRPLFPVGVTPLLGEWGRSPYIDLTAMALELGKRFSGNSKTLDRYAMPMLVMKGRTAAMVHYEGPGQQQALRAKASTMTFEDGRQEPVWCLPEGIESVEFVSWDAQQQASFSHIDRVEDAMFAMSALPYGIGRMAEALASGASLRRLWLPTYVLLEQLRGTLIEQISLACVAAGEMLDIPVEPDSVNIEWPNPLDIIDEQRIVQGKPEDMADPANTSPPKEPVE